ncbi:hypothetical protein [Cognatazoarcus halotolerans]|uniref:hypothetical protein n=1 Tax=Cognatazoarcus halotolerans TaxID=2686016 RepID=UPI00135A97F8|nr:hypothetical protein [Cognatazoarcus halotolerans]
MSIKQLCFDAHTQLRDQHGIAVRRTHLYELLAALLGFNSHAALAAEAVIGQVRQAWRFTSDDLTRLSKRCLALGYPTAERQRIVEAITALAETHRLVAVDVKYLVKLVAGDADGWDVDDEEMPDDVGIDQASSWQNAPDLDLDSTLLIDGLEQLAAKEHVDAHYALALLLECDPPKSGTATGTGNNSQVADSTAPRRDGPTTTPPPSRSSTNTASTWPGPGSGDRMRRWRGQSSPAKKRTSDTPNPWRHRKMRPACSTWLTDWEPVPPYFPC